MLQMPVYLNCHLFKTESDRHLYVYRTDASGVKAHPFQLFKLKGNYSGAWENLSVYATVDDAVMILLKELFTAELKDEIIHGQATVNLSEIMERINRGDSFVSLYASTENE